MHLLSYMHMAACADRCASKPQVRHENEQKMMVGQRINRSHMLAMCTDNTGYVAVSGVGLLTCRLLRQQDMQQCDGRVRMKWSRPIQQVSSAC